LASSFPLHKINLLIRNGSILNYIFSKSVIYLWLYVYAPGDGQQDLNMYSFQFDTTNRSTHCYIQCNHLLHMGQNITWCATVREHWLNFLHHHSALSYTSTTLLYSGVLKKCKCAKILQLIFSASYYLPIYITCMRKYKKQKSWTVYTILVTQIIPCILWHIIVPLLRILVSEKTTFFIYHTQKYVYNYTKSPFHVSLEGMGLNTTLRDKN
jgi:hypothetical protein